MSKLYFTSTPTGEAGGEAEHNVRKAGNILRKWAFSIQTTVWFLWDLISTEQKPSTYVFDFSLRVGYGWMDEPEKIRWRNTGTVQQIGSSGLHHLFTILFITEIKGLVYFNLG